MLKERPFSQKYLVLAAVVLYLAAFAAAWVVRSALSPGPLRDAVSTACVVPMLILSAKIMLGVGKANGGSGSKPLAHMATWELAKYPAGLVFFVGYSIWKVSTDEKGIWLGMGYVLILLCIPEIRQLAQGILGESLSRLRRRS